MTHAGLVHTTSYARFPTLASLRGRRHEYFALLPVLIPSSEAPRRTSPCSRKGGLRCSLLSVVLPFYHVYASSDGAPSPPAFPGTWSEANLCRQVNSAYPAPLTSVDATRRSAASYGTSEARGTNTPSSKTYNNEHCRRLSYFTAKPNDCEILVDKRWSYLGGCAGAPLRGHVTVHLDLEGKL
jgi:hypothetical protein